MKTDPEIKKLWKCPKCGRQFKRKDQSHSCKTVPLEQHFNGKEKGKLLYEKFSAAVKRRFGSFKVESLECCIHFVSTYTFTAVKIFKDKIVVDFTLEHIIQSKRIKQELQMSANRYLYIIDVLNEEEIDDEIMEWIGEAYHKK